MLEEGQDQEQGLGSASFLFLPLYKRFQCVLALVLPEVIGLCGDCLYVIGNAAGP